jgi:hypothetical protein
MRDTMTPVVKRKRETNDRLTGHCAERDKSEHAFAA